MPVNKFMQLGLRMPLADVVAYTTSGTANKVMMNITSPYPYTDYLESTAWYDVASHPISDVLLDTMTVESFIFSYYLNIASGSAYGYNKTRGSAIIIKDSVVMKNYSVNFTVPELPDYYEYLAYDQDLSLMSPTVDTPDVRYVISAQRGGSGSDNRRVILYAYDAEVILNTYADVYEYFYYYRAIDNASRGSMGGSPANGSLNIEGTYVSSTFTPNPGYYINYINDSAASNIALNSGSPFVHNIASYANRTITCYFEAYSYTVGVTYSSGGTASASPAAGEYGYSSSITYTPSYAYELEYLQVNGVNVSTSSSPYVITNITANKTVYAKFRRQSNMQACIGGTLKRLDMYSCIGGTLKPIITKFCIGGTLKG